VLRELFFHHQSHFFENVTLGGKDAFYNEPAFASMSIVTQRLKSLKREIKNFVKISRKLFLLKHTATRCLLNNLVDHVVETVE
jgi:hypothetical protein